MTAPPTALSIVRQKNMLWMFFGNLISNIGTWFQNIAGAAIMFDLTKSSLWVGAVNFALFSGALVLAPFTGNAADRYDRRRLLIVSQATAAVVAGTLAVLSAAGRLDEWVLISGSLLLGLSLAFMAPAMLALVPLLVEDHELEPAVSLNSVSFNLGRAIGPVLGAAVLAGLGATWAFGLNAATFIVFSLLLLLLRPRPQVRLTGERPKLRESLAVVRGNRRLAVLLAAVGLISVSTDPIFTLTAEMAQVEFGGTKATIGYLVGAFGVGATLTAFFLLGWIAKRRHALVGSLVAQGIGVLLFAAAPSLEVALIGLAISGGGFLAGLTRVTTRIQLEIADELRGRVMAIWTVMFVGTRPISAPIDGAIADLAGPRVAAALFALPAIGAAVWIYRIIRAGGTAPRTAE